MPAIKCGVPQISVVGPLLFVIYCIDMTMIFKNAKIQLFADNTYLMFNIYIISQDYDMIYQNKLVK